LTVVYKREPVGQEAEKGRKAGKPTYEEKDPGFMGKA
jgi:hypothetical protein